MNKLFVLLLVAAAIALVEPHGFVREPLARTSVHRLPNHGGAQQPFWWTDMTVWCGNVPQDLQFSTCGRCGDNPGQAHANQGGRYDKGIITGTYMSGEIIEVIVEVIANSRGHFEFDLCGQETETDTCFQRLHIVGGNQPVRNGNMMCSGTQNVPARAFVVLPGGVRCSRCTLRWTWRTSPSPAPDACFNPNPAHTFRNCVDIRIY